MPLTQIIALAISGISSLVEMIIKLKEVAKQAGEMTPEEESAFDAQMEEIFKRDWWKVDSD